LDVAAIGPRDPRRLIARVVRADCDNRRGEVEDVIERLQSVAGVAREDGHVDLLPRALLAEARACANAGRLSEAMSRAAEAADAFTAGGDSRAYAEALLWLGIARSDSGEAAAARDALQTAHDVFESIGDEARRLQAAYELSIVDRRAGRLDVKVAREIADGLGRLGRRIRQANAIIQCGEIERQAGNFDAARAYYREALEIYEAMGSGNAMIARLNLGLALMADGRYREALHQFEETASMLEFTGWASLALCADVEVAACLAGLGDFESARARLARAERGLATIELADPDLAWAADELARLCADAGETELARRALALAIEQWDKCEKPESAAAARHRLRALEAA
jgi:tetratricopeptide (TPR) repeat protein